jgi:hypothetical protein
MRRRAEEVFSNQCSVFSLEVAEDMTRALLAGRNCCSDLIETANILQSETKHHFLVLENFLAARQRLPCQILIK